MSDNFNEINRENNCEQTGENLNDQNVVPEVQPETPVEAQTNDVQDAEPIINENEYNQPQSDYQQYNNVNYTENNQNNGYNNDYNNNGYNPYAQPTQQQSQWTYNDYGPIEKKPKKEKVKKEKKPHEKGYGFKVLSIVLAVVLFVSIAGFSSYIIYDMNRSNGGNSIVDQNQDGKGNVNISETPTDNTTSTTGKLESSAVYTKVQPSVVGIVTYVRQGGYTQDSQGSGVIYDADGYIVTNAHVITNSKTAKPYDRIEVILSDGTSYVAQVLGADTQSDLAVIKIDAKNLTAAELGDSTKSKIGDKVFALGNPNGVKYAGSFSQGIISGLNREVFIEEAGASVNFMQVDAAINPGNSGGALINEYGQVIGITSAKIVAEEYEGIGFAIPMADAKPIIESLMNKGYVSGRVMIGITYTAISESIAQLNGIPKGLRVVDINSEFDVAKRDVKKGDIIYQIDGKDAYDAETVKAALKGKSPNDEITLSIYRVDTDGKAQKLQVAVKLGEQKQTTNN